MCSNRWPCVIRAEQRARESPTSFSRAVSRRCASFAPRVESGIDGGKSDRTAISRPSAPLEERVTCAFFRRREATLRNTPLSFPRAFRSNHRRCLSCSTRVNFPPRPAIVTVRKSTTAAAARRRKRGSNYEEVAENAIDDAARSKSRDRKNIGAIKGAAAARRSLRRSAVGGSPRKIDGSSWQKRRQLPWVARVSLSRSLAR